MTKEEALKVLAKMRAWRQWGKGEQDEKDRPEMPEQKEVDEAFDICIEMLSNPSLPSNMATAAIHAAQNDMCDRQIMEDSDEHRILYSRVFRRGFKAGAEWMAGQGVTVDAKVCKLIDRAWVTILDEKQFQNVLYDKFNLGDKVVVQIRKK